MPMEGKEGSKWQQDMSMEELCESTWKEIYRFIYYKVQNREEAEDITQETYAKAIAYLNTSNMKIMNYRGFLKTISLNIIRDQWRTNKRRGGSINIDDVNPEDIAAADFAGASDDRAVIETALESLTQEQQTVIILRIMKGYSSAETAKIMNKKEGTVRVLQYRAIKALANVLKNVDDKGGMHYEEWG